MFEVIRGFYTFPKGICPKVNVSVTLEFEPCSFEIAIQYISYSTTGTPHFWILELSKRSNSIILLGPKEIELCWKPNEGMKRDHNTLLYKN